MISLIAEPTWFSFIVKLFIGLGKVFILTISWENTFYLSIKIVPKQNIFVFKTKIERVGLFPAPPLTQMPQLNSIVFNTCRCNNGGGLLANRYYVPSSCSDDTAACRMTSRGGYIVASLSSRGCYYSLRLRDSC